MLGGGGEVTPPLLPGCADSNDCRGLKSEDQ